MPRDKKRGSEDMRLGLSTSCSATFRQLSIFLATFLFSSNFLSEEQLDAFFYNFLVFQYEIVYIYQNISYM